MGVLTALRPRRRRVQAAMVDPSTYPLATPWGSSTLEKIVFDDIFGTDRPENTRAAALRIPTVLRARNLLVYSIARNPLAQRRRADILPAASWMSDAGNTSPQMRTLWTADDLLFYGWSCWWRGNDPASGLPIAAGRVPFGEWRVNDDNRVEIDGQVMPDNAVILFNGIHEGILTHGRDALDDARTLYANVRKRLAAPTPGLNLQHNEGPALDETEIDALIARWAAARRGDHGGVSYTSKGITPVAMGGDDGNLMIESRNAAAVDLARLVGVTAGLVDATAPKASLNYETQTGRNEEFVDRDLGSYMDPIAWRLSLDDVTPEGEHVAFDLSAFTDPDQPPAGPTLED